MNKFWASLLLLIICSSFSKCKSGGNSTDTDQDTTIAKAPAAMSYSVINTFPHDTSSYTQGLLIYKKFLYEGTGNYGKSKIRKIDLKTGTVENEISIPANYFGEGITILNDTLYQLTYKEKKVLVYTVKDFKKVKEFDFINGEGWGITNDGKQLIVSTGSSDLHFFEPSTFKLIKSLTVTDAGSFTYNINELEYINGYIYANQYTLPYIFKIDAATGVIVAKADVNDLWLNTQKKMPSYHPSDIVPNGIAYDADTKKIYITGKYWPQLYEVQFGQ